MRLGVATHVAAHEGISDHAKLPDVMGGASADAGHRARACHFKRAYLQFLGTCLSDGEVKRARRIVGVTVLALHGKTVHLSHERECVVDFGRARVVHGLIN